MTLTIFRQTVGTNKLVIYQNIKQFHLYKNEEHIVSHENYGYVKKFLDGYVDGYTDGVLQK